jgi:hypothetical protein
MGMMRAERPAVVPLSRAPAKFPPEQPSDEAVNLL